MRHAPKPRIALAWDRPASAYSAGWVRYLVEQSFGYPVSVVRTARLARAELDRYDVIVLPDARGGYGRELGGSLDALRAWIRAGGTLVTVGAATRWLTEERVGLLATKREDRAKPPAGDEAADKPEKKAESGAVQPFDLQKAIRPETEAPDRIPGAIVRLVLDPEHWLAFGYPDGQAKAIVDASNIYTPVKLDRGRNVAVYASRDELVVSGVAWKETADQLAQKAYLVHQPMGRGHVVAFADDPNFRAFQDGLNQLFLNALFLGPAF